MAFLCTFATGADAQMEIRLRGSDTLGLELVPRLVEEYRKLRPELSFQVAAEGTGAGFMALHNGTCDIGMATRPAKPEEIE